jgi:heat shock protein HslJ
MASAVPRFLIAALAATWVALLGAACGHMRPSQPKPPQPDELMNATYVGVTEAPVTLVDGRWEGETLERGNASRPWVELAPGLAAMADLDGDGLEETAVVLSTGSGGSGVFSYLAVAGRIESGIVNLDTSLIGDRVQIRALRIASGTIEIDVVQAGSNDPACCPAELATRSFVLREGGLAEGRARVTGELGLDTLDAARWRLTHFARDEPAPQDPAITLIVSEGRLTGSSGCNRYSGGATAGDAAGEVTIGPLAGTRMACPEPAMSIETRYLQALQSTVGYAFANGKLALTRMEEAGLQVMLFERDEVESP